MRGLAILIYVALTFLNGNVNGNCLPPVLNFTNTKCTPTNDGDTLLVNFNWNSDFILLNNIDKIILNVATNAPIECYPPCTPNEMCMCAVMSDSPAIITAVNISTTYCTNQTGPSLSYPIASTCPIEELYDSEVRSNQSRNESDIGSKCYNGSMIPLTNGVVCFNSSYIGSSVTYECDSGYFLIGSAQRTCQCNGNWSGSVPECTSRVVPDLDSEGSDVGVALTVLSVFSLVALILLAIIITMSIKSWQQLTVTEGDEQLLKREKPLKYCIIIVITAATSITVILATILVILFWALKEDDAYIIAAFVMTLIFLIVGVLGSIWLILDLKKKNESKIRDKIGPYISRCFPYGAH